MTETRDNLSSPPRAEQPAGEPSDWYGWVHVLLAAAAMIGTLPGRTHGLGLITEPLLGELGLDRTVYADINLWATLLGAAFCWPAGILLDRFGIRRVLTAIALLLGTVVISMTYVKQPAALFLLILLTRALGQSMLSVASLTLVGKSFALHGGGNEALAVAGAELGQETGDHTLMPAAKRCPGHDAPGHRLAINLWMSADHFLAKLCPSHRRFPAERCLVDRRVRYKNRLGMAMGVYSLLIGVGFAIAFKSVGQAVLDYGWRATWSTLGYALILFLAPVSWLLVRQQRGQPQARQADSPATCGDFTVRQALASQAFWVFAVASSIYGLISSGIGLFNQAILAERGFQPETYHTVLAVSSLCGMLANLSGGWAATRVPLGRLLAAAMAMLAVSLVWLPLVTTEWEVFAYAVGMGAAGGIVTVSFFTVWAAAFGPMHLGKIQGWAQMMTVVASAAGPTLFAKWHAATGSYAGAFYCLAPIALGLGFMAWITKLPQRGAEAAVLPETPNELELAAP